MNVPVIIRREYFIKRESMRQIAREFHHGRKTIHKAIMDPGIPVYSRKKPRGKPVIGPYLPIIKQWLKEDRNRPLKPGHMSKRIHRRQVAGGLPQRITSRNPSGWPYASRSDLRYERAALLVQREHVQKEERMTSFFSATWSPFLRPSPAPFCLTEWYRELIGWRGWGGQWLHLIILIQRRR